MHYALLIMHYSAGAHLQRTGDTMAPSFFNSAKALSTSFRSAPNALVTSPADTGFPASRMAFNTCSFITYVFYKFNKVKFFLRYRNQRINPISFLFFISDYLASSELLCSVFLFQLQRYNYFQYIPNLMRHKNGLNPCKCQFCFVSLRRNNA